MQVSTFTACPSLLASMLLMLEAICVIWFNLLGPMAAPANQMCWMGIIMFTVTNFATSLHVFNVDECTVHEPHRQWAPEFMVWTQWAHSTTCKQYWQKSVPCTSNISYVPLYSPQKHLPHKNHSPMLFTLYYPSVSHAHHLLVFSTYPDIIVLLYYTYPSLLPYMLFTSLCCHLSLCSKMKLLWC